jgi:tetraacyldisaccharide 4'-kinase
MSFRSWLETRWYSPRPPPIWLRPLAAFYGWITRRRRRRQTRKALKKRLPLPVIVVGNISVGGTGKTPLVIWLVERLREWGYKPGVISRGYGGHARKYPLRVTPKTKVSECGDEPAVLAQRVDCPIVVAPNRLKAARMLAASGEVDVIVADDGLQHYRLPRDIEICVVDGQRGIGNGALLPAGPLRELPARFGEVDLVVVNSGGFRPPAGSRWILMQMATERVISLANGQSLPLARWMGQQVHAVAGIGHPERFFSHLQHMGIEVHAHPFPDHHRFSRRDLRFNDPWSVLMTEKDAIKCRGIAEPRLWYVPAAAEINAEATSLVRELVRQKLSPATKP